MPDHPEECIHGMEYGCVVCCKKQAPQSDVDSHPFTAEYDDWCRECRLDVMAGDRVIYRTNDEIAGVIHEECA